MGGGKKTRPGEAFVPGQIIGQYHILRLLGRGGMGEVYEAENTVNRKKYALKILPREATGGNFIDRFRIESRVMSDLRHPHIVQVHHAGEDNGLYYLTMDLITGAEGQPASLEDRLSAGGTGSTRMDEKEVRRIALQICDALAYAHSKQIIHRDLKPANVLLDEAGEVRVADFGLAKVVGPDYLQDVIQRSVSLSIGQNSHGDEPTEGGARPTSSARALLGTYDYMSPEQKAGAQVDARTDLYAFGVMLYRMLTGDKPEGAYKAPSRFGVNRGWDAVVEKCLQRSAGDRFASAEAVGAAIHAIGRRSMLPIAMGVGLVVGIGLGVWVLNRPARSNVSISQTQPPVPVVISEVPRAAPVAVVVPEAPAAPVAPTVVPVHFSVTPSGTRISLFGDAGLAAQGTADEAGRWETKLLPGRYELEAQHDGYQMLPQSLVITGATEQALELIPLRGALTITTVPGAVVTATLNGNQTELGRADAQGQLKYERLVEGVYELSAQHEDYFGKTNRVEIRRDKPQQSELRLEGRPGSAYVSASPQAEVWVDGVKKGLTGEVLNNLLPGSHPFEVRKGGYRTERFTLDIPPNKAAPRKVVGDLSRETGSLRVKLSVPAEAKAHFQGVEKRIKVGSSERKTTENEPVIEGLSCEAQTVSVEVSGYTVGQITPIAPLIRDSQTTDVEVVLTPQLGTVIITANVSSAVVDSTAGRVAVGQPVSVMPFLDHALRISAVGYAPTSLTVRLDEPGEKEARVVVLEERKEPPIGEVLTIDLGGRVTMEVVWIPAGDFVMGSPVNQDGRYENEGPQHQVTIANGFWLGKTEVTQRQYMQLTGSNPSKFKGAGLDAPVENVNWNDAKAFCKKLQEALPIEMRGLTPRLPTEAEWEYACRVGTTWPYEADLDQMGWSSENANGTSHKVAQKAGNIWGIYDMYGNVWEWCEDGKRVYTSAPQTDPMGPAGASRVLRGGSWNDFARYCRSAFRNVSVLGTPDHSFGFRVVVR